MYKANESELIMLLRKNFHRASKCCFLFEYIWIYFATFFNLVYSGARSGSIFNHDVRVANHHISSFNNHTQEICGLQWSPDGKLLASGANDNTLNVWDMASTSATTAQQTSSGVNEVTTPLHSLCEHMAAVKVCCIF